MSQQGSQPAAGGPAIGQPASSLAAAPPPRTSSLEPSAPADASNASSAAPKTTQEGTTPGQLGVPGQADMPAASSADASGGTMNEKAESIGGRSKRSVTGRRKRDASAGSKRSAQQQPTTTEKDARPTSAGRTGAASSIRPKKKSGFLSFLNCCAAPDEGQEAGQSEGAQPAKTPKSQPVRAQQPTQQKNTSTTATSTENSKEVVDEKSAAQIPPQAELAAAPVIPLPESDKPAQGDATVDRNVPTLPSEAPPVQPNPETRPLEAEKQPEAPVTGVLPVATSTEEPSSSQSPDVQVDAPTPVVQQDEDAMILDRTPEQAARDNDIEMSDSGPSLPLTGQDAAAVVEEEKLAHQRRESSNINREDLPPPPPIQKAQEQHDGAVVSQEQAAVSTPEQTQKWLLPPPRPEFRGKKCLVLDLDETLVHSSFKILHQADFTIPVEIEGQYHNVYVIKRPGVDTFMKRVGELYEIVVFTASVSKYGDPLLDQLDIHHVVHHRLFRESCYNHQGNYVKDLSQVGRDLKETIIIDNSPTSYIFHPQHAVPISSWFSDAHDNELLDLIPVLEDLATDRVSDVSIVLDVAL
ncbi:uncharacterized protein LTR77_001638 [Saxophila tyrrhenica]|uniref:FCP1 homology domain-containing protein n=1 Tax=Saxophila tyrrhenica TaxID=1690608 RepID=A0AAV9PMP7_9PEZI|nr:hypothetical protein LTR77_001638 [Saxophila tyrrhenica]